MISNDQYEAIVNLIEAFADANRYDYPDNFTIAEKGDLAEEQAYAIQAEEGCCGRYDDVWGIEFVHGGVAQFDDGNSAKQYLIGFNYGH